MTRLAHKLREKLIAQGVELPECIVIERLYPGHWMRSEGAWVWHLGGVQRRCSALQWRPDRFAVHRTFSGWAHFDEFLTGVEELAELLDKAGL